MTATEDILRKMEEGGYRATASRRRLVDALVARGDGFTAEELVAEVGCVGRATVYRTIRLLVEQGLLCKLALQAGAPRYALSRVGHHHHLVCVRCGAVREFRRSVIEAVLKDLQAEAGGAVVGHSIEVYVLCSTCQAGETREAVTGHPRSVAGAVPETNS